MAKESWLTVDPMSGTGNSELTNVGATHKGRIQRETVVTAVVRGIEAAKSYSVVQKPTSEYITLDDLTFDVGEEQAEISVSGKSNSPVINITNSPTSAFQSTFSGLIANGLATTIGQPIQGDPGATDEFAFSFTIIVPKNTIGARVGKVTVSGSTPEVSQIITLNQATSTYRVSYSKGDYVQSISKASEIVNYGGIATAVATLLPNDVQYTYSFDGWYEGQQKVSGDLSLSVENITSARTFVAVGQRTLNRYTLAFTITPEGGGTVQGGGTYDYGSEVSSTAVPSEGYTFTKWIHENGTEITANPTSWVISGNRKIQAIFTINSYNIATEEQYRVAESGDFTSGTTGGTATGGGTFTHGSPVTLTATPSEGYGFDGWYEGSVKVSSDEAYTFSAAGNRTLIAKFQRSWFTIAYVAGTGVSSVDPTIESVKHGDNAVGSTATVSTGYTFDGWYNGDVRVSTSITYAPADVVSDITLTAKANINVYTVTPQSYYRDADNSGDFASGESGGTVSGGGDVNHGSSITVTASPATGYDFVGWFTTGVSGGDQLSTDASYQIDNVTASRNVYARFQKRWFTVNYVAGEYCSVSSSSERVAYGASGSGSTLTPFETTAEYSYAVDGWYNGETKVSSSADFAPTNVTSDLTYTAKATRTLRSYLVTYVAGDYISGVSPESETVNYGSNAGGSTATVQSDSPEWLYSFDGWYDEGGTKVSSSLTYGPEDVTGDRQIEARGTRTANTAEISVSMDSSSSSRGSVSGGGTYTIGSTATVTCSFNSGDVFDGWYEGGTRVSTDASYSFTVTGARSLVAKVLYLDVSPSSLNFGAGGGTQSFTISTNIDGWSIS